jgi:hypothetical protein
MTKMKGGASLAKRERETIGRPTPMRTEVHWGRAFRLGAFVVAATIFGLVTLLVWSELFG